MLQDIIGGISSIAPILGGLFGSGGQQQPQSSGGGMGDLFGLLNTIWGAAGPAIGGAQSAENRKDIEKFLENLIKDVSKQSDPLKSGRAAYKRRLDRLMLRGVRESTVPGSQRVLDNAKRTALRSLAGRGRIGASGAEELAQSLAGIENQMFTEQQGILAQLAGGGLTPDTGSIANLGAALAGVKSGSGADFMDGLSQAINSLTRGSGGGGNRSGSGGGSLPTSNPFDLFSGGGGDFIRGVIGPNGLGGYIPSFATPGGVGSSALGSYFSPPAWDALGGIGGFNGAPFGAAGGATPASGFAAPASAQGGSTAGGASGIFSGGGLPGGGIDSFLSGAGGFAIPAALLGGTAYLRSLDAVNRDVFGRASPLGTNIGAFNPDRTPGVWNFIRPGEEGFEHATSPTTGLDPFNVGGDSSIPHGIGYNYYAGENFLADTGHSGDRGGERQTVYRHVREVPTKEKPAKALDTLTSRRSKTPAKKKKKGSKPAKSYERYIHQGRGDGYWSPVESTSGGWADNIDQGN